MVTIMIMIMITIMIMMMIMIMIMIMIRCDDYDNYDDYLLLKNCGQDKNLVQGCEA